VGSAGLQSVKSLEYERPCVFYDARLFPSGMEHH
jgi:hypothetical protein